MTIATGVPTSTVSTIQSFGPVSTIGLDTIYDKISFPSETDTASIPESTIPAPVLGDLGITALGGLEPTGTPLVSPTATAACQGNQIQGSCTQAPFPSATPDSGLESPVSNKVDSSGDYLMFNATQTSNGVSQYCSSLISSKAVLSASGTAPEPGYVAGAAENGGYVAITVLFDVDSCDPDTSSANQQLDFGTWTLDNCYQYLYGPLAEACKYSY